MSISESPPTADPSRPRRRDPEKAQADIIAVATRAFAEHGLAGARIDAIASETRTSKRMIYYYFGDKEGLYRQVLEAAYRRVRQGEADLRLDDQPPVRALETLVAFTLEHHRRNPDFVRLVMIENIHNGRFLAQSDTIRAVNADAIAAIARLYRRGCDCGLFRDDLEPLEIHWLISALAFFNVSNAASFALLFDSGHAGPARWPARKRHCIETVLRFVLADGRDGGEAAAVATAPAAGR